MNRPYTPYTVTLFNEMRLVNPVTTALELQFPSPGDGLPLASWKRPPEP